MAAKALTPRERALSGRLYGRDHELRQLSERLEARSKRTVLLKGPSGIGKSALVAALQRTLRVSGACLLQEIESHAHSLNHLLGQLTAQIVAQSLSKLTPSRFSLFRKAINDKPHEYTWALLSATASDIADKLAPNTKKTLETLLNIASKASEDSSSAALAERIKRAAQDDILASFFSLLNLLSKEGISGCIIIDCLEAGSEAVLDAVLAMSRCMPGNWNLLVAVNDEIPEGLQALSKVWPPLSYLGAEELELGPLDVSALELWKNEVSGNPGTIDELHDVIENTGGRPLFLADWVSGVSTEAASRNVVRRLGAYYKQRLALLSGKAKHLLQLLSLLPSRVALPFTLIRNIVAPQNPFDAYEILSELEENNFIRKVADENEDIYKLNHELISRYVARELPRETAKAAAQELLNAIVLSTTRQDQRDSFVELHLADLAGRDSELLERAIPTAERLVSAGSYAAAIETYKKGLRAAENMEEHLTAARARLGIATSLLDTGSYREALEILKQVRVEDEELQALAFLIHGRALIRLNSYAQARAALDQARVYYGALDQASGQIEVEKEINTILRDLGRHREAVDQATQLVGTAQKEKVSPLVQASCFRALARSLALTGEKIASLRAGNRALDIARAEKSWRSEGNAHLAKGEAFRHGRQFPQALAEYQLAADIAEKLANRDSWLWSLLGAADSLLLLGQLDEALARLADLGAVLKGASKRYPLEYLHWRLSLEVIRFIKDGKSPRPLRLRASKYASLGISWPALYVEHITRSRTALEPKKM